MSRTASSLKNKAILLVEDDYFLMSAMMRSLEAEGVEIIGPAPTVEHALTLATTSRLDAAVLDINLQGEMAFPVADALRDRQVPFLFTTGYDDAVIPAHLNNVVRCEKPARPEDIIRSLIELTELSSSAQGA